MKNILRTTSDYIPVKEDLEKNDKYDVIFAVMQFTQVEKVVPILKENVSENIVIVRNNMNAYELEEKLKGKNVWFGFYSSFGICLL